MTFISSILYIIILVNTFCCDYHGFREPREIAATWGWLIVLVILPVIGFIMYFFFGRRIRKKRIFNLRAQRAIGLQRVSRAATTRDLRHTKGKIGPANSV